MDNNKIKEKLDKIENDITHLKKQMATMVELAIEIHEKRSSDVSTEI